MQNHPLKKYLLATFLLAAVGFAGSSHAVDGVFEISQACVGFGCVPGDSAGLPVTITESGSYRLTSNLSTTSANTTLILVNADDVSIDLNGFSLTGPAVCSGSTVSCTNTGSGDGIDASNDDNIIIRNGTIRGMGDAGIRVSDNAIVEDVVISSNAGPGLSGGSFTSGGVFRRLSVSTNGGPGVGAAFGSHYLMDSVVINNGDFGVFAIFCGNVLMVGNDNGNSCVAIAPNECSTAADCD